MNEIKDYIKAGEGINHLKTRKNPMGYTPIFCYDLITHELHVGNDCIELAYKVDPLIWDEVPKQSVEFEQMLIKKVHFDYPYIIFYPFDQSEELLKLLKKYHLEHPTMK